MKAFGFDEVLILGIIIIYIFPVYEKNTKL